MRNEHMDVLENDREQVERDDNTPTEETIVIEEIVPEDTTAFIMSAGALSTYEY